MPTAFRRLLAPYLLLGTLASGTARAQDTHEPYQVPEELRQRPQLPEGMDKGTARALALTDAIQIAVQQNLGITLSREQARAAEHLVAMQWGRSFEPKVTAFYSHSRATTPPAVTLIQNGVQAVLLTQTGDNWNVGAAQTFETGTQLSLLFTNTRTFTSTGGTLPLVYNAGLNLTLVQPLLKGFAFDVDIPRQDVLRARFDSSRAREDVRIALIAAVKSTDDAYWDLVQALKAYAVQRESLRLADQQLVLTQRQIDAGILAPSDLITVESTQAQRQYALLQAEAQIGAAADALRAILNLPRSEWEQPLVPTDAPTFVDRRLNLEEIGEIALKNRPEIAQGRIDVEKAALNVRAAKADRLPQLDAGFTYGLAGQKTAYGDALDQVSSFNVPTWTASVNFSWSPLLRQAQSNVSSLEATESARHVQLDQVRLNLYAELRGDLRNLELAARQVRAAAKFRDLAQRALDAEQRKFLTGNNMSNNILVGLKQDQLAQAQSAELAALVGHHKASTAIDAAMGILLEQRGIDLQVGR
jgi:outer membrane protein TolC